MNSGVLDLKTRRNVSLAPAAAGAVHVALPAARTAKAPALTRAADAPASVIVQVSRTARIREALIVSIGCAQQVFALRFAKELPARATRGASRAISGLGDRSVGALAPPANGKGPRPTHPRRRQALASQSWKAM